MTTVSAPPGSPPVQAHDCGQWAHVHTAISRNNVPYDRPGPKVTLTAYWHCPHGYTTTTYSNHALHEFGMDRSNDLRP